MQQNTRLVTGALVAAVTVAAVLGPQRTPQGSVQISKPIVQAQMLPGGVTTGVYAPDGVGNGYQDYKLWLPDHGQPAPLLMFNLGGGWTEPSPLPENLPASFEPWVEAGFAFALCRYTWTDDQFLLNGEFPAAEQDAQRAIQHFRHNASRLRLNPDAICAMGRSAGAHNMLWAMLRQDAADSRLEGQGSASSKPDVVLLRALALVHLPASLQHQFSTGVKHYVPTGKLKDLGIGAQLNASATTWLDEAAPGTIEDIPVCLTSGSQKLIYGTDFPYPSNAIGFNHDPWNGAVLWARLQERGGVHLTHSRYVSLYDTPLTEQELTKQQIRWTRAMLDHLGQPLPN